MPVARVGVMRLRGQHVHWWEMHDTQPLEAIAPEPTVWVDPNLFDERPVRKFERLPSPSVIGAYCTLDGSDG